MTNLTELQTEAINKTNYWINFANKKYNLDIEVPLVTFNLRGRTAGKAITKFDMLALETEANIRYNPVLLEENGEAFLKRTVPHEVAHIIVRNRYWGSHTKGHTFHNRPKPHGWEWQGIMEDFGLDPKVCHNYNTTNSRVQGKRKLSKDYTYKCACRTHKITIIRHRRMVQRGTTYFCKKCKAPLVLA